MTYNNSVLIGNWSEERLNNERPMAISGTYVMYGFNVQIVATDMPAKPKMTAGKRQYGLAMSILVQERQVSSMQGLRDGCLMTMSPILTPCCRNTFLIASVFNETVHGKHMKFGDEFLLKAVNYVDPKAAPLYVRYEPSSVPEPTNRMPLRLSDIRDSNCRFTIMPLLPCDRLEGLGKPVKAGTKAVIKNLVADKSLCVMNQNWMQTFFGAECGVTCKNYIDIHGRHTAENVFALISDVDIKTKD